MIEPNAEIAGLMCYVTLRKETDLLGRSAVYENVPYLGYIHGWSLFRSYVEISFVDHKNVFIEKGACVPNEVTLLPEDEQDAARAMWELAFGV